MLLLPFLAVVPALDTWYLGLGDCRLPHEPLLPSSFRLPPNGSDARVLLELEEASAPDSLCMQVDIPAISGAFNGSALDTDVSLGLCAKGPVPNDTSTDSAQAFAFDAGTGHLRPLFENASGLCVTAALTLARCEDDTAALQWAR